jgi:signal transduction histidine kinase
MDPANQAEHIFIVDRDRSQSLTHLLPDLPVRVLLRPVNPVLFRSLLAKLISGKNGSSNSSDRDQMLQLLLEMNVRLQEYDQDRSHFIYKILNDLREPLIGFDGYCDLLMDRKLGPLTDEQAKALQSMQQGVKRLFRVAASIQELCGSDQLRQATRVQPGDIEGCVDRAVQEIRPLADRRSLRVDVQIEPPGKFWFDEIQIEQLMVNLLDSACRHSAKGSEIRIQGCPVFWDRRVPNLVELTDQFERRRTLESRAPNAFRIEVTNTGNSIPQDRLDLLFHDVVNAGGLQEGVRLSGLGLATCKQIVNRHSGRMFAESSNGGSRFMFELPLTHQPPKGAGRAVEVAVERDGFGSIANQA